THELAMATARFLFVLFFACCAVAQEGFRVTELRVQSSTKPFLTRLDPANTGVYFSNYVSEAKQLENSLLADGAGVAAGDVDGESISTPIDGEPTTSPEFTNRYVVDVDKVVRERGDPDVLYLNDGKGHFKTVSWTDGSFLDEQGKPWQFPDYDFGLSVMFRE